MDDYRKPPKVNRYWSRPKLRVYECNLRDAERMYQESYKQYLAEKDYRYKVDKSWSSDISDRFAHLRAGPLRRETSVQPPSSRYGEASSLVEGILSRSSVPKETTTSEPEETKKVEHKPISAYDPQKENASLEERLERLKRLREDLGLPTDTRSSQNTLRDSATRTFANDVDSSYKSERSSRVSNRAAAATGSMNDESSSSSYSSYRSERASKANGIGGTSSGEDYRYRSDHSTDEFKVTPRSQRKNEEYNVTPKQERKSYSSKADKTTEDYSFSSKSEKKAERFSKLSATAASSSSPTRSRKAVAAAAVAEAADFDENDDATVAKMMKKLPSSQEILDRISKMELDD